MIVSSHYRILVILKTLAYDQHLSLIDFIEFKNNSYLMLTKNTPNTIEKACDSLLANKSVRYVGILNKMGNLVFEKEQKATNSLISDKKSHSLYIRSVLEILLEKDFDEYIGSLKYDVSHRTKIDIITIPLFDFVILISVEPNENTDVIANSAITIFEKIL